MAIKIYNKGGSVVVEQDGELVLSEFSYDSIGDTITVKDKESDNNVWNADYSKIQDSSGVPVGGSVSAVLDYLGSLVIASGSVSVVNAVVSSAASQTLLALNTNRFSAKIYNGSDVDLLVKEGATASATSFTWSLLEGETLIIDDYSGVIDAISVSSPTGNILVTETT